MLRLKNVTKEYKTGKSTSLALSDVTLELGSVGLTAVLGASGCGKTTLLNILGGLDTPTSGEITVWGRSLAGLDSAALDEYRRHTVGFIFQGYNLIPQETALGNLELALSLSGAPEGNVRRRATEALISVGLTEEHLNKRPSELSGGEGQRVAIARALVKEPRILLADEPTGALDEDCAEQIMELLSGLARSRSVILVTHNTALAEKYADRIIRLDRGRVVSDAHTAPVYNTQDRTEESYGKEEHLSPLSPEDTSKEETNTPLYAKNLSDRGHKSPLSPSDASKKRSGMNLFTAARLSLKNLLTKKLRTALVSIGSAIAVMGLAAVVALNAGMSAFVSALEGDIVSANPITVSSSTYDLNALSGYLDGTLTTGYKELLTDGKIGISSIGSLIAGDNALSVKNKLTERYFKYLSEMPEEYYGAIRQKYGVDLSPSVYTDFTSRAGDSSDVMSLCAITAVYQDLLNDGGGEYSNYLSAIAPSLMLLPSGDEYLLTQYDLTGKMASYRDELVLVLDSSGTVSDLNLAFYGYISAEEIIRNLTAVASGKEPTLVSVSPEELLSEEKSFTFYPNDTIYERTNDPTGLTPFSYSYLADGLSREGAVTLRVTGILTPKENVTYGALPAGLYYTSALEDYAREVNLHSEIADYIRAAGLGYITSGYSEVHLASTGVYYQYTYTHPTAGTVRSAVAYMSSKSSDNPLISGITGGFSNEANILTLAAVGGSALPNEVQYYPTDFESKERITAYLDRWNNNEDLKIGNLTYDPVERDKVVYTDNSRAIIYLIKLLADRITLALIIATSLSLIVSSMMISVIIFVSVGERTKEIGILRALGAGKGHIASLFLSEGCAIGALSSALGIALAALITALINGTLAKGLGIVSMSMATLTPTAALVSFVLGTLLALLCSLAPSLIAAAKAPVDAIGEG